jgi:3',5'-cyclic AMP phosphodiesterase CpdA
MTAPPPPFHLLHLTDLHLPPPGEHLHGTDPGPRLAATVAAIAARHRPDGSAPAAFAVVTGDLTRDGEPEAYARLREMLAGLPCPAHLMLGNHDDRATFRAAFPGAPVDADGFVQQALPSPAGLCLMLDTLEPGRPEGRLCERRLGWLAARLAEGVGDDGPVLLFLHHPPLPVGIRAMDAIGLMDTDALWEVLAPHRARLRHVFHGHLHRPIAGSWRGVPISSLRGTAFTVALDLDARGGVGVEARPPPCYAVARILGPDLVVHTEEVPAPPPP